MSAKKIGIWMYQNGGGAEIEAKLVGKLKERGIESITGLNLRHAYVKNNHIYYDTIILDELDLFFSYNAGEQTKYQVYLYQLLDMAIPMLNSYRGFFLSEDKLLTSFLLRQAGIPTPDFRLYHRDDTAEIKALLDEWERIVYKPTDGWGGIGVTKIESQESFDMLLPFLNQTDIRFFYVEKFLKYDNTDFRIDLVDGKFVACYGRKAAKGHWKTNITSGGSVFSREAPDEAVELAIKAADTINLEIAGVDIIYDMENERYVVLEINGIPAFATPDQEKLGLDFNDKKIGLIVDLIEKKVNHG